MELVNVYENAAFILNTIKRLISDVNDTHTEKREIDFKDILRSGGPVAVVNNDKVKNVNSLIATDRKLL